MLGSLVEDPKLVRMLSAVAFVMDCNLYGSFGLGQVAIERPIPFVGVDFPLLSFVIAAVVW